jgi:hypothetical protein
VGAGRQDPLQDGPQTPLPEHPIAGADTTAPPSDPGFLERGGLRRRLRFLRKTRELAYRDLGGLVFEMHRFGQQREDLLAGKLATLQRIDTELRAIEEALHQGRGVTVLREAGVTACPRCAAIHGSEDRFCPACGFSAGGSLERPIAAAPVATPASAPAQGSSPARQASSTRQASPDQKSAPGQKSAPTPTPTPAPAQTPAKSALPPAQSANNEDQPTQVIEPPTQIVRPGSEPPAGKPSRA